MSAPDPLAEFREIVDKQRDQMQGGLNTASPGAGVTQIVEILAAGFGLALELLLEIRDRLPGVNCENCQDCGRVQSGLILGRVTPLINYCYKGCRAAQREILRDQHIHQILNPGAPNDQSPSA